MCSGSDSTRRECAYRRRIKGETAEPGRKGTALMQPRLNKLSPLRGNQVGEDKSVALHYSATFHLDWRSEHGASPGKGVKLPVLAAGINLVRQIRQQLGVKLATRK